MEMKKVKETIAQILIEKKTATVQEILYAAKGVPAVQIYGALAEWIKSAALSVKESEGKKTYTLVDQKRFGIEPVEKTPTREEQKPVIKIKEEKSAPKTETKKDQPKEKNVPAKNEKKESAPKESKYAITTTRDTSLFRFDKQDRGKGQTVLAVIKFYSSDKTLAQIKSAFPDSIVSRYGCTADLSFARSHERQRYFIKDEQIITTSDSVKKKLAVTNQWDVSRFNLFLEACKKLGIKITRVEKDLTDKKSIH